MYNVYSDVILNRETTGGFISSSTNSLKEWSLFHNSVGVVDGNSYGIALNSTGVAVDGFPDLRFSEVTADNIYFEDVHVTNHSANIREIPSFDGANDVVGAVFQSQNVDSNGSLVTIDAAGNYIGNVISNAQALVASAISNSLDFGVLNTSRNSIGDNLLQFVAGNLSLHSIVTDSNGNSVALGSYQYNGDTMNHANKGVIGFKFDAIKSALFINCSCSNISNIGNLALTQDILPVPVNTSRDYMPYYARYQLPSPKATYPGYGGADVRGFSFSSSYNIVFQNLNASNIVSQYGLAYGVDVHRKSSNLFFYSLNLSNITGGAATDISSWMFELNPTHSPVSSAFHSYKDSSKIFISDFKPSPQTIGASDPLSCGYHALSTPLIIESNNVLLDKL